MDLVSIYVQYKSSVSSSKLLSFYKANPNDEKPVASISLQKLKLSSITFSELFFPKHSVITEKD